MRTLTTVVLVAGAGYLLLCVLLFLLQERMVFLSELPGRALVSTPRVLGLDYEDVYLPTADGVTIHGWYVHTANSRATVLFFHGNAGNISHRLDSIAIFSELGLDVFIIDYRGYGRSEGRASERGTYEDAAAAWAYLVDERGLDPQRVFVFGRSLGGAVAIWLAARRDVAGLIVESTFTSAGDMAARLYPFLPARRVLRLRYPSSEYLQTVSSPVAVIHSRDDEIVPFAMGQALYEAAAEPKAFVEIGGSHNSGFLLHRDRYKSALSRFIAAHLPRG